MLSIGRKAPIYSYFAGIEIGSYDDFYINIFYSSDSFDDNFFLTILYLYV